MSIVAVKINEKGFTMSADSICVRGWTQEKGERTDVTKLVRVNGLALGFAGYASEGILLSIFSQTRQPAGPTHEAIINFLAEFSEWKNKRTGESKIENQYLIGFKGKAFRCHGWAVMEVKTFEAVGAGEDFALSAMHLGHSTEEAVKVACELSAFCELPAITIEG